MGWFGKGAVKSILNVPEQKKIDVLIALGYYERQKISLEHDREPMDKIASFNTYWVLADRRCKIGLDGLAPRVGFEPTTKRLTAARSTTELLGSVRLVTHESP